MNLYLVKRIGECDYDEYDSFVVRAETCDAARLVAADAAAPAGSYSAENSSQRVDFLSATCINLASGVRGKAGVILGSLNAG